ncbi:MAG TPA: hypothetical protein ENI87_10200 [bacterium]|nr:hypothetical protein [bacterium]
MSAKARHVRTTADGAVFTITLDRPEARNAYSDEMVAQLVQAFDTAERDPEVHRALERARTLRLHGDRQPGHS